MIDAISPRIARTVAFRVLFCEVEHRLASGERRTTGSRSLHAVKRQSAVTAMRLAKGQDPLCLLAGATSPTKTEKDCRPIPAAATTPASTRATACATRRRQTRNCGRRPQASLLARTTRVNDRRLCRQTIVIVGSSTPLPEHHFPDRSPPIIPEERRAARLKAAILRGMARVQRYSSRRAYSAATRARSRAAPLDQSRHRAPRMCLLQAVRRGRMKSVRARRIVPPARRGRTSTTFQQRKIRSTAATLLRAFARRPMKTAAR